ncbi:MAG: hypothetical protein U9P72_02265 [Campylobacterota bacterium]|nr:hypothetical protein [Campylobacterota bacterium]
MTNKEKKLIVKAVIVGSMHAVVVPLVIMLMVNLSIDGNFGGVAALAYLIIPTFVYAKSKNKDISKAVFFGIWKGILTITMFYILFVIA